MKLREGMTIRRRDFGDVREGKREKVVAIVDGMAVTRDRSGHRHITEVDKLERWFEECD